MSGPGQGSAELPAREAAARIRTGAFTSAELVAACLDRIEETDATRGGWAEVDRDGALGVAREMDALRRHGLPLGTLHGVPVAIDEVFGAGPPTPPDHGRNVSPGPSPEAAPDHSRGVKSAVTERLSEAGAVVIGRTRAGVWPSEPAASTPPVVRPLDAARTAGAPCGAAAAAVGTRRVPLAVICEAEGAVIRSASYCGVFGFRPSRGIISRRGAVPWSPTLAQVGTLGRTLEDVAFLADVLAGYDAADSASYLRPRPRMYEGLRSDPPVEPDFIWLDTPWDDRLSAASNAGFDELRDALGRHVARFPTPAWFARLPAAHRIIVEYEAATGGRGQGERSFAPPAEIVERGLAHGEERYRVALAAMEQAQRYFSELFHDYDAVMAPATAGEAPSSRSGEEEDAVFCAPWSLCGLPALCVPLLTGETGLPVGLQLIGGADEDDRLLRATRWSIEQLLAEAEGSTSIP